METVVRELWDGCLFCLNPRHPGPCAKPKSDAAAPAKPRKRTPGGGGGGGGGGKQAESKPAAAKPAAGPAKGRDMVGDDPEASGAKIVAGHKKYADGSEGPDSGFAYIAHQQGFTGKPQVVSKDEMDAAVAAGGTEMFRGARGDGKTTAASQLDAYRTSEAPFNTGGQYGAGTYFASRKATAAGYGDGSDGSLMRASLHPQAKVIKWKDLMARHKGLQEKLNTGVKGYRSPGQTAFNDPGRLAASLGFDAVEIPSSAFLTSNKQKGVRENYIVVVNRTALLIEQP